MYAAALRRSAPKEFRLDSWNKLQANFVLASRFLRKNNNVLTDLEQVLSARHQSAWDAGDHVGVQPVREISSSRQNTHQTRQLIRSMAEPLHFPGFAKNSPAVSKWTMDFFKQNYGDTKLRVSGENYTFGEMRLSEIIDLVKTGERMKQKYVQAIADMFVLHPELFNDLPMEQIFRVQKRGFHGAEFFLGGPGTGSTWHAANEWNFFLMLSGRKHWKLVRPEFTLEMKPAFQRDLIFVNSKKYGYENPPNITTYDVTLEPGDMMVVPPWWWHCVQNETDETIAASVRIRTLPQQFISANQTLTLLQLTAPHQWRNFFVERILGELKDDHRYHERSTELIV